MQQISANVAMGFQLQWRFPPEFCQSHPSPGNEIMIPIRTECAVLTLIAVCMTFAMSGCEPPQQTSHRSQQHVEGHEVTVTDENFQKEVLQSDVPVLVDFWATWCGPCRDMEPVVATLSNDFSGRVKVAKVDVDVSPNTAAQYEIAGIPAFYVFKDGKVVGRIVGAVPYRELAEMLENSVD